MRAVAGCLGAQTGTQTFLVVWPSGTKVVGSNASAIEVGDHTIEAEQSFVGKGTFVSGQPFPTQFPEIPLQCLGPNEEKIAWVQEIDQVNE